MCVYNGQRYLGLAIESILRQTFTDFEFLIINDGSTDKSHEIITSFDDFRIRLVDNPGNLGLTKSLNRGLDLARGELIARQDADDTSHTTRLERQVAFMDSHHDVVLLGTKARYVDEKGCVLRFARKCQSMTRLGIQWQLMLGDPPFVHSSVMFRRVVVCQKFQGYNTCFITGQDCELWGRIASEHDVRCLPETLVDHRVHQFSISGNLDSSIRAGHTDKMQRLIHANLIHYLHSSNIPTEWARIWVQD
jgi:glycosyltransferase involved in cell wall biosynthesis